VCRWSQSLRLTLSANPHNLPTPIPRADNNPANSVLSNKVIPWAPPSPSSIYFEDELLDRLDDEDDLDELLDRLDDEDDLLLDELDLLEDMDWLSGI